MGLTLTSTREPPRRIGTDTPRGQIQHQSKIQSCTNSREKVLFFHILSLFYILSPNSFVLVSLSIFFLSFSRIFVVVLFFFSVLTPMHYPLSKTSVGCCFVFCVLFYFDLFCLVCSVSTCIIAGTTCLGLSILSKPEG